MSFDALVRPALSLSGASPLLVRSAFSRHPIAADIATRFCWASVGLSSSGEIRRVCPIRVWRPFSTDAAGPTSPVVASAPTTPPLDGLAAWGGADFPEPSPQAPSTAAAPAQQRTSAA